MSTFTRSVDSETLTPIMVYGPYENELEAQTVAHRLAQSADVRVTYRPLANRTGEFGLLWSTYDEAHDAARWFGRAATYHFDGPSTPLGYVIVDGMVVMGTGEPDATYAMDFIVSGPLRIRQDVRWELTVPFTEVTE